MRVGIIDYGLGNLKSVSSAIKKIGHEPIISAQPEEIARTDKIILPGVGAFGDGMSKLHARGLIAPLNRMVLKEKKPILGICLGAQLMAEESYEFGYHEGLGWIEASVVKLDKSGLKLPHVSWNNLFQRSSIALFKGIPADALFYYVHSFHIRCRNEDMVVGECEYGIRFTAAIQKENIYATQFHPEKSQLPGLTLLLNFLNRE